MSFIKPPSIAVSSIFPRAVILDATVREVLSASEASATYAVGDVKSIVILPPDESKVLINLQLSTCKNSNICCINAPTTSDTELSELTAIAVPFTSNEVSVAFSSKSKFKNIVDAVAVTPL